MYKKIISLTLLLSLIFYANTILANELNVETDIADGSALTIMTNREFDVMASYVEDTQKHINIVEYPGDVMDEISKNHEARNSDVDIYFLDAHDGLYEVKEKGYFAPLTYSEILVNESLNLYPAFREALSNSSGEPMAWVMHAQPFVRAEITTILSDLGIDSPASFDDLLDVCQALIKSGVIGDEYSLMDIVSYCQEDMLDFYVRLYIQSSQREYGFVDFSNAKFLATVERIKNELPSSPPVFSSDEAESFPMPVISLMMGFETINTRMLPLPTVLEDAESAIETYMTVAIINPTSNNLEEAIDFLEYCAEWRGLSTYFYNKNYSVPAENQSVVNEIESMTVELEKIKSITEPLTTEQQDQLDSFMQQLTELESRRYFVTPDIIDYYADFAKQIYVSEASPLQYDMGLMQIASQYLDGEIDLETFSRECQMHVEMIYAAMAQ